MEPLRFAYLVTPGRSEAAGLLLADSIRSFGGRFAAAPISAMIPTGVGRPPEVESRPAFEALGVSLQDFDLDVTAVAFPFAAKVFAAAAAETASLGRARLLVWMDVGSLVLQEPTDLLLPEGKILGYRPVDHTVIGSPYYQPADAFWSLVYQQCQVRPERLFPMPTSADGQVLRPYFNAGMLVVRPEAGLLASWRDAFARLYQTAAFTDFYTQDHLYRIFIHQAILAGAILARLSQEALFLLPHLVNYPLHMHRKVPPERRPATMEELISCRYEDFFQEPAWADICPASERLRDWLTARLNRRPAEWLAPTAPDGSDPIRSARKRQD